MLLLAKITAVTIGMVLTLNGAERPLPQLSLIHISTKFPIAISFLI